MIGGELEIKEGAKVTGLSGSAPAPKTITSEMIGDGEVKTSISVMDLSKIVTSAPVVYKMPTSVPRQLL
ncbi:hypothetical protein QNN00_22875 [Bacillus velezensis]|nr:hypothetical protein [Bacillus velezensis]